MFCVWIQNPAELDDWLGDLNPHSKVVITDAFAVSSLESAAIGDIFQFERLGTYLIPVNVDLIVSLSPCTYTVFFFFNTLLQGTLWLIRTRRLRSPCLIGLSRCETVMAREGSELKKPNVGGAV